MATPFEAKAVAVWTASFSLLAFVGCGGPSGREVANGRAFEALLSAVSLQDAGELERDALAIAARHDSGELSDSNHREIAEVIAKGRAKDWAGASRRAYEFRSRFGDSGAYFK